MPLISLCARPTRIWTCALLVSVGCARPNPLYGIDGGGGGTADGADTSTGAESDNTSVSAPPVASGSASESSKGPGDEGPDLADTDTTDPGPPACGDGIAEEPESCDGRDLAGASCASLGLSGDGLVCTRDCELDASSCTGCGNARVDGPEECDPAAAAVSCDDLGWDSGELFCTDACLFDESGCYTCGDGLRSGAEECDTDAPLDCVSFGWDSGDASCDGCLIDLSGCCNDPGSKCAGEDDCCDGECVDGLCTPGGGSSG